MDSALNTIMCLGGESNKELEAWNNGERRWEETWRSFIYKSSAHRLIKRSSAISACIIFINHFEEWHTSLQWWLWLPFALKSITSFIWSNQCSVRMRNGLWILFQNTTVIPESLQDLFSSFHNRDTLSVFTSWWLVSQAQIRSGPWLKCFNCLWMFKTRP